MDQILVSDIEVARLKALQGLGLLSLPTEKSFDRITRLTKVIFNTPIVLISFAGDNKQCFKSKIGINIIETPAGISFCSRAIEENRLMVVDDALLDERFRNNPLVIGEPFIRFYAGAILYSYDKKPIGTLCIIDTKPRTLAALEQDLLVDLAKGAQNELYLYYMRVLQQENKRLEWVTEQTVNGILYTDENKKIVWCNEGFSQMSGYTLNELLGKNPGDIFQGVDTSKKTIRKLSQQINAFRPFEADILNYTKQGKSYWVHIYGRPLEDETGRVCGFVAIQRDITGRIARSLELEKLANLDELTGLTNRRYFDARLEKYVSNITNDGNVALLIIDLNRFKSINDEYGHLAGDKVLCAVASKLINASRQNDLIARLGGDEFAIVIRDITSSEIKVICDRLLKSCAGPVKIGYDRKLQIGMSIGVAFFPEDADDTKFLFEHADKAMYYAKQNSLGYFLYSELRNAD